MHGRVYLDNQVGQGVSDKKINPGNIGGTVDCGPFTTTFVQALHSSSFGGHGGTSGHLAQAAQHLVDQLALLVAQPDPYFPVFGNDVRHVAAFEDRVVHS